MAYRRPKGIDKGEDRSAMTHIPKNTLDSWDGGRENLEDPNPSNALLRSEAGRAMVKAKHKVCRLPLVTNDRY